MIKELRELIEDISSINTSIDVDDIKLVAGLNNDIIANILNVRDYLIELNLPKEVKKIEYKKPEIIPAPPKKEEKTFDVSDDHVEEVVEVVETENKYKSLIDLGITEESIKVCEMMYNGKSAKMAKMSFSTLMKCCVFVHNYIVVHGAFYADQYTIGRLIVNRELEGYLKEIDPDTTYVPANIYDFLATKNFKAISTKFFECNGTVLIARGKFIDKDDPFDE